MTPHHILAEAKHGQFELVGSGLFAQVMRVVNTEIAIKIPDELGDAYTVEKQIYERLGSYPFILKTYGEGESIFGKGLMLQYLPAGALVMNLELEKYPKMRTQ